MKNPILRNPDGSLDTRAYLQRGRDERSLQCWRFCRSARIWFMHKWRALVNRMGTCRRGRADAESDQISQH